MRKLLTTRLKQFKAAEEKRKLSESAEKAQTELVEILSAPADSRPKETILYPGEVVYDFEIEQNSAGWVYARLGIPTASSFDKILTPKGARCKAETTQRYMNKLLAEWVIGEPLEGDDYQSQFMELGHENEPAAVNAFQVFTEYKTKEVGIVTAYGGLIGASPDRLIVDSADVPIGTLEAKSPASFTQIGYLLASVKPGIWEELSEKYKVQTSGQMWLCRFDLAYLIAYHGRLAPICLQLERDERYISILEEAVLEFVAKMLELRLLLEEKFGPFVRRERNTPAVEPDPSEDFGVSLADLEGWLKGA